MTTRRQVGLRIPHDLNEWCTKISIEQGVQKNSWIMNLVLREYERIEGVPFTGSHDIESSKRETA